jgi:hypothetical protein
LDTTLGSATFGVGEFIASESAAVLSAVDWAYREAKDIGYALICAQRLRLSRLLGSFAWHWLRSLFSRLSLLAQGHRSLLRVFCLCLFDLEYSSLREPLRIPSRAGNL